jgi:hypothetical protein
MAKRIFARMGAKNKKYSAQDFKTRKSDAEELVELYWQVPIPSLPLAP